MIRHLPLRHADYAADGAAAILMHLPRYVTIEMAYGFIRHYLQSHAASHAIRYAAAMR